MEEFTTKEEKETLYHGGFLYIGRLDKLLAALDQLTLERDLEKNRLTTCKKNFHILKALYKELESKMEKDEKKRQEEVSKIVTSVYREAIKSHNQNGTFSYDVFELFDEWEIELRAITEARGLLMPDKDNEALGALR